MAAEAEGMERVKEGEDEASMRGVVEVTMFRSSVVCGATNIFITTG